MAAHLCHARGCNIGCRPEMLMCYGHWRRLPVALQRAVWSAYVPGQCELKPPPSTAWHAAADAAIAAVWQIEQNISSHATLPPPPPLTTPPPAFATTPATRIALVPAGQRTIELPASAVSTIVTPPVPSTTYEYRFFISHPKSLDDEELEQLEKDIFDLLREPAKVLGVLHYVTKLARDDYTENFARCNGWDGWVERVTIGTEFASGRRCYDGIVCTGRTLGKASAQIVHHALQNRKPVGVLDDWRRDGTGKAHLSPVAQVVAIQGGTWAAGWRLL